MPKNARETRSLQLAENLFACNSIEAFSDLNGTGDKFLEFHKILAGSGMIELDEGIGIKVADLEELRWLLLWV